MTEPILPLPALSGLTVLDFTQGVAGPHATQLMAQHGATVIKIEPPSGDWGRTLGRRYGEFTAHSIAYNRGKHSVALNLKHDELRAIITQMATQVDIIAESFRPGVMARFGLDYPSISKVNPKLVFLSISGFGQDGPYRDRPVTDAVIQAHSGWMAMNKSRDGTPLRSGMVAMDVMTGLYGFQAVVAAVLRSHRFGQGDFIDCSLMQSAMAFQAAKVIEHRLQDGKLGNLYAPVGAFRTASGIINITAMRDDHFRALCQVLGVQELLGDPRFATGDARIANEPALEAVLSEAFMTRPASEWSQLLTDADVMNSVVQTYDDVLEDPQITATNAFQILTQPSVGTVPVARVPGTPAMAEASPEIGADTSLFLLEHGATELQIAEWARSGDVRLARAFTTVSDTIA